MERNIKDMMEGSFDAPMRSNSFCERLNIRNRGNIVAVKFRYLTCLFIGDNGMNHTDCFEYLPKLFLLKA